MMQGKCEAIRMKKKLESDVLDLETALEHANAANAETQVCNQFIGVENSGGQGCWMILSVKAQL